MMHSVPVHVGPRHWYAGTGGGVWHHSYCPPGGVRFSFRNGGYYYAPHHYSWNRWGNGWGWGCYGWWGGRYQPYRWGLHPYYGWGYWPYDIAIGSFLLGAAIAAQPTTTTTTTTVLTGTPVSSGGVMTGTPVSSGMPTLQYQTAQGQSPNTAYQIPPPGFGFPFPEYDGKSDPPKPPTPDANQSASAPAKVDESKDVTYVTSAPKEASEPTKIDFDYSKPPSEVPYFAEQIKASSSSSSQMSTSSGGMSGDKSTTSASTSDAPVG